MEVVVATSVIAHFAVLAIDRYIARLEVSAINSEDIQLSRDAQPAISSTQPQENETHVTAPKEGSIEFLEARLKQLRNQAKRLNAPDTLVQYARVTREANRVEKELNEKKAAEGVSEEASVNVDALSRAFTSMITPGATSVVRKRINSQVLRTVPRVLAFAFLWYYFSWTAGAMTQGNVMTIECDALRPISWMFRKQSRTCAEEDWLCAAQRPLCAISYSWALVLCNVVIAKIFKAQ